MRRHQPYLMAQRTQLPRPVVRRRTRLHPHWLENRNQRPHRGSGPRRRVVVPPLHLCDHPVHRTHPVKATAEAIVEKLTCARRPSPGAYAKARVLGPSTINAPNQPICSARYAPSAEPALLSCSPLATPKPCNSISTKSQPKLPQAHMPFSFSIKPDGTAPKTSRLPKTSRSCRCRRVRQSSTLKKTFGSSCGRTGCQTAESGATRTPIPAQGGQHSGDCGQQVMAA